MKNINEFILEKLKINSKSLEDKFEKELNKLISEYLFKEYNYKLNDEYKINLSEDHDDLLIDFNEDLKLSERKLMDIGQEIKQILKKNRITCWSEPMLRSSNHNKSNHQINLIL